MKNGVRYLEIFLLKKIKFSNKNYRNTEEFIEDQFNIDIRYILEIDCNVTQNGFRPFKLLNMLAERKILLPKKKLEFEITKNTAVGDYDIYWKVLNRGDEAKRRDKIRGQIIKGDKTKIEYTKFIRQPFSRVLYSPKECCYCAR